MNTFKKRKKSKKKEDNKSFRVRKRLKELKAKILLSFKDRWKI
jgi:hypothetical protein